MGKSPEREPGDVMPTDAERRIRGHRFPLMAADSETLLIAPGNLAPRPVCFTAAHPEGRLWIERADQARIYLAQALKHRRTIWANAPFDLGTGVAAR